MAKKVTVLLGAGSSIPAGFPSTEKISCELKKIGGVRREGKESYNFSNADSCSLADNFDPEAIQHAYCTLATLIEPYYQEVAGRTPNYEDVYYYISQLHDIKNGEFENYAIKRFYDEVNSLFAPIIAKSRRPISFSEIIAEMKMYSHFLVANMLGIQPEKKEHCKIIEDIIEIQPKFSGELEVKGIATLCHDNHLETYLRDNGCSIEDGFADPSGDVRLWRGFGSSITAGTPFLKLHGSVDWYRFRQEGQLNGEDEPERDRDFYAVAIRADVDNCRLSHSSNPEDSDSCLRILDSAPVILIGSFNKIPSYAGSIFIELIWKFRESLWASDVLFVCGYGFGDKGINRLIAEWVASSPKKKIIVAHNDESALISRARATIGIHWDEWKNNGTLKIVPKRMQELSLDDLINCI